MASPGFLEGLPRPLRAAGLLREALAFLRCPACGGELELRSRESGGEILNGALVCRAYVCSFRIREGLPVLRLPECLRAFNTLSRALYSLYAPLYDRLGVCVMGGNLPYIRARTGCLLVGLVISEEMLRIYARKVEQLGLGPVHLFLGCAEHLPFAPGTFNKVLIGGVSLTSATQGAL